MNTQTARVENMAQLELREFARAAIYMHYGWTQDANGRWQKGANSRDIPATLEQLYPRYHKFYERVYIGGKTSQKFFENAYGTGQEGISNFDEKTLPQGHFFIITGVSIYEAQGASGTDTVETLSYGTVAEDELENAFVGLTVNTNYKPLEKMPIKPAFSNGDTIEEFLPLAVPCVWEPNKSIQLEIESKTAIPATNFPYVQAILHGIYLKAFGS